MFRSHKFIHCFPWRNVRLGNKALGSHRNVLWLLQLEVQMCTLQAQLVINKAAQFKMNGLSVTES